MEIFNSQNDEITEDYQKTETEIESIIQDYVWLNDPDESELYRLIPLIKKLREQLDEKFGSGVVDTVPNYKATKYPKIYRNTYWGHFEFDISEAFTIENRNSFVEELSIIKCLELNDWKHKIRQGLLPVFDHAEFYKTATGYIFVVSPYQSVNSEILTEHGFSKYKPLYDYLATTYYRKFDSLKDIRNFLRIFEA